MAASPAPPDDGERVAVHDAAARPRVPALPVSTTAVLIPVKAFSAAKHRLADVLDAIERSALARDMASAVVRAARALPVWVVCDDDEVASWATDQGASVCWKPGRGLNGAVSEGVADLAAEGLRTVVVAHADLPHAQDLSWVANYGGVTIVPDRHGDGTNVIAVPAASGFVFAYGPASFSRHQAEAERLGLRVRVVPDDRLGWDVDLPADLEVPPFVAGTSGPLAR